MEKSKGYFTKHITPESLVKMYEALGKNLSGKVAVKVHSGEKGVNVNIKMYNFWNIIMYNFVHYYIRFPSQTLVEFYLLIDMNFH